MTFNKRDDAGTLERHLVVDGTLVAQHEKDDEALEAAVVAIVKKIPNSPVPKPTEDNKGFDNCFDFVIKAVKALNDKKYMSDKDYEKFKVYHDNNIANVKKKTDAGTIKKCHPDLTTRGVDGKGCHNGQKPLSAKFGRKPPSGKKP
jgi:thiamine kinase-like enzyme